MHLLDVARILLGLAFVGAGLMHFIKTGFYVFIMPPYLPCPVELVWISGVCEVLGGIGVMVPATRVLAAWGLIALLVAVYPANVHMALHHVVPPGMKIPQSLLWLRLPLQFVFIWMVWWCCIRRA